MLAPPRRLGNAGCSSDNDRPTLRPLSRKVVSLSKPLTNHDIPSLTSLVRKGLPGIVESALVPLAIFYVALWTFGMWGALIAALAWAYLAILRRVIRKEPLPGLAILGALALTTRTALSMFTGSVILYFLQPSVGTALVGLAFLVSIGSARPLIQRLAADFLPVPSAFFEDPSVKEFFKRISPIWAAAMLANAAITTWMLFAMPISFFLAARTVVSASIIGAVGAYSIWALRRLLKPSTPAVRPSRTSRLTLRPSPIWGLTPQFALR